LIGPSLHQHLEQFDDAAWAFEGDVLSRSDSQNTDCLAFAGSVEDTDEISDVDWAVQ
jgi:hypothetical protein